MTLTGVELLKEEIDKRNFINIYVKYQWILTVLYHYLASRLDIELLKASLTLADEAVGKDKIAITVN